MTRKLFIILILCVFASFSSCKKAPLTVGSIVTEVRELPNFREVHVNDNINISLVRSDTCLIEITTGNNIIGNITAEVSNGILSICNTTTLNWLRPYDYKIEVTLYFKDIANFIFASSGTLVTKNNYTGQLASPEYYRFEIHGGSGDVDLNVNNCSDFRVVYQHGTSRLNLHGENNVNLVIYKRSYGIIDARNYHAETANVTSDSATDCFINASKSIDATLNDFGNIYYKGNPENIQVTYGEFAKGKLLPLY